ncbi:hypothetical protein Val02_92890 [Virgisporangium aliadipatigenens]|uniref:Uncharacterized protein n=1 Tax=Virgisporangium aliadipatigenens TaxID=741659 RepID=A0A8J3YZG7_9ACTN|nr:hypothetical protein Val02_92890 [Virgisporangium aliadipatigenens]
MDADEQDAGFAHGVVLPGRVEDSDAVEVVAVDVSVACRFVAAADRMVDDSGEPVEDGRVTPERGIIGGLPPAVGERPVRRG